MYYRLRVLKKGCEWGANAQCEANTIKELQTLAKGMVSRNKHFIGGKYSIAKITGHKDHEFAETIKTGVIEG